MNRWPSKYFACQGVQGFGRKALDESEYNESIDEKKHADSLVERILFLEGLPTLQDLDKLLIGEDVRETPEYDIKLDTKARAGL